MAYKFQTGAAQMDGNLSQDGTLSGSGDLHLATAIDINGSEVLNATGGGSAFTTANSMTSATALVSVSALNAGSIASGFGAIDNGTSNQRTGGQMIIDVNGTAIGAAGALTLGASQQSAIYDDGSGNLVLDAQTDGGINPNVAGTSVGTWDSNGINLVTGDAFYINSTSVLNATTLGSAVVNSSLTDVGALDAGSITSGFGAIDNGVSNITTGGKVVIDVLGTAIDAAGSITLGAAQQGAVYAEATGLRLDAKTGLDVEFCVAGTKVAAIDDDGMDLVSGDEYHINGSSVLGATTLGDAVVASSLTSVGALNAGSITSGFGAIDNGTNNITTGGKVVVDVLGTAIDAAGSITLGAAQQGGIYAEATGLVLDAKASLDVEFHVGGTKVAHIDEDGMDLVTGDAYQINNTSVLNATTLGSAVVASSLTSVGTLTSLNVGAVTSTGVINCAGLTSSAGFQADSTMQLDGVTDAGLTLAADSLYFLDATDGLMHRELWSDIATAIAGTGITATAGVLSVTSDSSSPTAVSGGTTASPSSLSEGLNYGSTAMLGPSWVWELPSSNLAAGDVVRVKAPAGLTSDLTIKITGSGAQTIDGDSFITLESPNAAVSLFYVATDTFKII